MYEVILFVQYVNVIYLTLFRLLTTAVLLAQIWKPPNVAESHRVPNDTEEELHFAGPRCSVRSIPVHLDNTLCGSNRSAALRRRQHNCHPVSSVAAGARI